MVEWTPEVIDARAFDVAPPARHRFDAAARERFPEPATVQPLWRVGLPEGARAGAHRDERTSAWKKFTDFLSPSNPGGRPTPKTEEVLPSSDEDGRHYLVTIGGVQWMLWVLDSETKRTRLAEPFQGDRYEFDGHTFVRADYVL